MICPKCGHHTYECFFITDLDTEELVCPGCNSKLEVVVSGGTINDTE